jgi:hypothetical protein
MSYGFKFINTNGELVIDDSNVKPWYINGSIAGTTNFFGMNYRNVDQTTDYADFNIFSKAVTDNLQPSDVQSDLYHPHGTWSIYELRYIAPDISDCFYAYTLPRSNDSNVWYFTQDTRISQLSSSTAGAGPVHLLNNPKIDILPTPGTGDSYVSIFAMVPDAWLATATAEQLQAAVPKVYFFANKEVGNNILSNGYGMQVFNDSAKCMYDSAKLHIQFKSYSFQDWAVPPPPYTAGPDWNGSDIRSTTVNTATPPSNTAFVIPTVAQYYYTESVAPYDGVTYGGFDIHRTMVQRLDSGSDTGSTSTIRTRTVKVTGQSTQSLGLGDTIPGIPSGTWWNYGTNSYTGWLNQQYKMSILAVDAGPLERGYSASDWPSTFNISVDKTTAPEANSNTATNTITFTLRTSRVASNYQAAYTLSGTNITASDISQVVSNSTTIMPNSLTGYFTVVNNIATIAISIAEDFVTEGTETLTLSLNSGLSSATVSLTEDKAYSLSFIEAWDVLNNGTPGFYESYLNNPRSVSFQLLTKNVAAGTQIPWRLNFNSTATSADFVQATSGNFTISNLSVGNAQANGGYNGTGAGAVVINKDFLTEGTERVRLELTNIPTVYKDFDIIDNSTGTPNATIYNPSNQTSGNVYLNEGQEYVWTVVVTNIPTGATLYPAFTGGTADAADLVFKDYSNNNLNQVTLNESGVGVFSITPTADVSREGLENFTFALYYPQGTKIKDYIGTIYINDTSRPPEEYTTTVNSQFTEEGQILSVTITSRYDYAHPLYWVFSGIDLGTYAGPMSLNDIASMRYENLDYLTTGGPQYVNITKSDRGTFSFPTSGTQTENLRYRIQFIILDDGTVEPSEFGGIDFYGDGYPPNGGSMLTTQGFFIKDAAPRTYTITPSATTLNEGDTLVWTITTTNVPNGTVLYWLEVGTTTNSDYNDNLYGSSVTINSNTGTISRVIKTDAGPYEGVETAKLRLYSDSNYSTQIAEYSSSVNINDTSTNVNEVFTISPTSVVYPNPTTVYITGGVPNTRVHFSLDNTNYDGFIDLDSSGNYTNSNAGPSEAVGSHTLYLRFDATGHYRQATWTVTAPAPTYSFSRDLSVVNEGTTITYTATTANVPDGTRIYWINYGSTDANDFTAYTNQGFITINSNTGSFYRTLRNDATTEGEETVWIFFYSDSGYNNVVGYVGQTTVNDTSTTPVVYNETLSASPSSVTYPNGITVNISGGEPNSTVYFSVDNTSYSGTVTLNSSGSYTNTSAGAGEVVGSHTLYVLFSTGHTRQVSWTVTAANPAAGTLLSTYCSGTTKYGTYADGSGGSYNQVIATNSTDCGYVAPSGPTVTNYSSATNDTGNVDLYGTPSATYDGLRCRGVGRTSIDAYVQRTFYLSQAATITGYLTVSSEQNYDFGYMYLDNVEFAKGSGNYTSGPISGPISAGYHTVKCRYTTDGSINSGTDSAFVEYVIS